MQVIRVLAVVAACAFAGSAGAHGEAHGRKAAAQPLVETEFGRTGDPSRVTRTVEVSMGDSMRFTPAELTIRQGETIRFRVRNTGKVMHEMVLGTTKDLQAHAEMMRKHPGMEHDEPYMAHVAPGKAAEMVWQFDKPGDFQFGCLVAGHFEAGMVGRLRVVAR
jgi:uncharacterized cupredoxin-like copper-binding protein